MKKVAIIIMFFWGHFLLAQVAIGKSSLTTIPPSNTLPNNSISIEFGNEYTLSPITNTEPRGLILPWVNGTVDTAPYIVGYSGSTTVVDGTIVFDAASTEKKVKIKYQSGWKDLSVQIGSTIDPVTSVDGLTFQDSLNDNLTSRVLIGLNSSTDDTPGVLVLTDSDKAMILPKVASPHLNIINPSPGLMVYDTVKKQLAVFNGAVWSFWKP